MKRDEIFTLLFVLMSFLLFGQLIVNAQIKNFTEKDKTQIIQAILKQEDFKVSETWNEDEAVNIINVLKENITAEQLPEIKGIKFVFVDSEEVKRRKSEGIEYYNFSEFKLNKKSVSIYFSRTYTNSTAREGNGSTVKYECRKFSGKWKVKGRLESVYAS